MKYLLDTHILIWALLSDDKLSDEAYRIINNPKYTIYYSAASIWEIAIKHEKSPSKMPISGKDIIRYCTMAKILPLPIDETHAITTITLKRTKGAKPHNDPFDKILISQAKAEGMILLTHDSLIKDYKEKCIQYV